MGRQEAPSRCVGCSLHFPEGALDEGLCEECESELELEETSDLDDAQEEERGMRIKAMPDGTTRYYVNGIRVNEKGERFYGAACRGGGHRSPHHLLEDPSEAAGMCSQAKQVALLAMSAATMAIAASGLVDETPAVAEGEDRLLTVKETALRLSVSPGWVYHNVKALPFAVRVGTGQLRFSEAGLTAYIQAKTAA